MDLNEALEKLESPAIESLCELVSIRSCQEDPVTNAGGELYPFGQGVQDAFVYMLRSGEQAGFRVRDVDHYGGHIEFGEGEDIVGIMGHLDVVPEGEGWAFDPYAGEVRDGWVLGRGTTDDKGPVLAAFYAMRALEMTGFEPKKRIRLILGLDEETGWDGMRYYLEHEEHPTVGFTPDANFPVIRAEKGILHFELAKKLPKQDAKGLTLRSLKAGTALNVVPETARAVVNAKDDRLYDAVVEAAKKTAAERGVKVRTKRVGKSLEITAAGQAAHASEPEKGVSALSAVMEVLDAAELSDDSLAAFIEFYDQAVGFSNDGSGLGIACSDEESGPLTFSAGTAAYDGNAISIGCDVRYPVTEDGENILSRMQPILDRNGLGIVKRSHERPIRFAPEDPLVQTLLSAYRDVTGDTDAEPIVTGGGTFARACPHIAAFGGVFPGEPECMHQRDEKLRVDSYLKMIRIYAEAIRRLASESDA